MRWAIYYSIQASIPIDKNTVTTRFKNIYWCHKSTRLLLLFWLSLTISRKLLSRPVQTIPSQLSCAVEGTVLHKHESSISLVTFSMYDILLWQCLWEISKQSIICRCVDAFTPEVQWS